MISAPKKPTAPALLAFRSRHQPFMARANYHHEMRAAATFPIASALAEGAFTGVVAAKCFYASAFLLAVITAAPMFGNIVALLWAGIARQRRAVPLVNKMQAGVVLCIAAVALTRWIPNQALAGWSFAALIVLSRTLSSGIVMMRSVIWRHNYPRLIRGQIVSRISIVTSIALMAVSMTGSWWLDINPHSYAILYPVAAAMGVIGIWQFSQIRVRREGTLLKQESLRHPPVSTGETEESGVSFMLIPRFASNVMRLFSDGRALLRDDPKFREYQWWQFVSGASFMLMTPVLIMLVSRDLTNPREDYLLSTIVLQVIPQVVQILSMQLWAPVFDRMHVVQFRVLQSIFSVLAHATLLVGAMLGSLLTIGIASVLLGITNSAGNLAWNLGHNSFTAKDRDADYMAVHIMLTGVRGMIMPFIGSYLYRTQLPVAYIFAVSTFLSMLSGWGFYSMSRKQQQDKATT